MKSLGKILRIAGGLIMMALGVFDLATIVLSSLNPNIIGLTYEQFAYFNRPLVVLVFVGFALIIGSIPVIYLEDFKKPKINNKKK